MSNNNTNRNVGKKNKVNNSKEVDYSKTTLLSPNQSIIDICGFLFVLIGAFLIGELSRHPDKWIEPVLMLVILIQFRYIFMSKLLPK